MAEPAMKICLVGDFTSPPDEGLKNVARYLATALKRSGVDLLRLNVKECHRYGFYRRLRRFDPDIVHYVPGITWRSLGLGYVLKQLSDARLVVSVLHRPTIDIHPFSILPSRVHRAFAPDLVFSHNPSDIRELESVFDEVELLPNGVDLEAFRPPTEAKRLAYRDRFDIGHDQFVVLHVGHLKRDRNVTSLLELQDVDCQVVVVASEYLEYSSAIAAELRSAGCTLVVGYRDDLDAIYGLADCYVFPVEPGNTLDMPLSVLEAMSCNLPVVTLEHPGLTALFDPGDGLWVEATLPKLLETVRTVRTTDPVVETRRKVRDYSWDAVATRALESYACL